MRKSFTLRSVVICVALFSLLPALAAEKPTAEKRGTKMQYGPLFTYSLRLPGANAQMVNKAISVKLSDDSAICFDCDTMRVAGGWTGGYVDVAKTNLGDLKGTEAASAKGTLVFQTRNGPGWGRAGKFDDPRPKKLGPLPAQDAHYKGLFVNGNSVVFSYTACDAEILELDSSAAKDVFARTIRIKPSKEPLTIYVSDSGARAFSSNLPTGAALKPVDGAIIVDLPVLSAPAQFTILIGNETSTEESLKAAATSLKIPADLNELCKGGPAQFGAPITTKGKLGANADAYTVDTLALPDENPWQSWIRLSGIDFLSDGRAVVSTLNGDIWIVSGIDDNLATLTWKRFAVGLFEPLGIKVIKDEIFVLSRNEITHLHDLNHDGEADFYESVNNDFVVHPSYHAFAFGLETDAEGNFYVAKGANQIDPEFPNHNCMLKISADGSKTEVFATGFRAPNGFSVGPDGTITCGDNQGFFMPASKISLIHKGGNYGFPGDPRKFDFKNKHKDLMNTPWEKPLCWIPYTWDTSSSAQVWVTNDKWGPLNGQMLHLSYGKCAMFLVLIDDVAGKKQGATIRFPLDFDSGLMRGRFNPKDGQLYVVGLKGWQTSGSKDGCLQRVRFTGKALEMPTAFHVKHNGIELTFASPLDAKTAADDQSYDVQQWNYKWSEKYGSDDYSVATPDKKGRDPVTVKSVKLSDDKKTVFLEIPDLKPVDQMMIKCRMNSAEGAALKVDVALTIHSVP